MSERTFDAFDPFADNYRSIHTQNVKLSGADSFYFAEMKVRLLQEHETSVSQLQVLDVGCGDGATELFMLRHFPQWKVQGIDVSKKSIDAALAKGLSNAAFTVYNGTDMPFDDNRFDVVFVAGVLHHVSFNLHKQLVNEIRRVLKPGGRLYLFEHNPLNPFTRYLVKTCVFDANARLLKSGYAVQLLEASRLLHTHKDFIIFFPRKGLLSGLIFLEKLLKKVPLGGQYFIRAVKTT
ncbi:MAG: hypothetical protein RL172_819 [Bacteroidota bacterium]|jgi:ubiquinone/menaquinone biosynthesis C-methylase UbiE